MSSRFDDPVPEEIGLEKPYDIYVSEANQGIFVYRGAMFRGVRSLARIARHDFAADFMEIEQSNGDSIFVRRASIVKFCEPGKKFISEKINPNS
jgi:hypothetical protein